MGFEDSGRDIVRVDAADCFRFCARTGWQGVEPG